jgi:hypothetical protein
LSSGEIELDEEIAERYERCGRIRGIKDTGTFGTLIRRGGQRVKKKFVKVGHQMEDRKYITLNSSVFRRAR